MSQSMNRGYGTSPSNTNGGRNSGQGSQSSIVDADFAQLVSLAGMKTGNANSGGNLNGPGQGHNHNGGTVTTNASGGGNPKQLIRTGSKPQDNEPSSSSTSPPNNSNSNNSNSNNNSNNGNNPESPTDRAPSLSLLI